MEGVQVNFNVPSNGGFYNVFTIDTDNDISAWTTAGYVYDMDAPAVALASMAITKDDTAKTLSAYIERIEVDDLAHKTLGYAILVKPGTTYGLRFFYGTFNVVEGGPLWS